MPRKGGERIAAVEAQQLDEAIALYREAVALQPRLDQSHFGLARLLVERGAREEALEHILESTLQNAEQLTELAAALEADGAGDDKKDKKKGGK